MAKTKRPRRRAATNLPYLPLYVGEVLAPTVLWSGREKALLLLLMTVQWSAGGPLPADTQKLAAACSYDHEEFVELWKTVRQQFQTTSDGRLVNARIEEHRDYAKSLQSQRVVASRLGVLARASKSTSGHSLGLPSGTPPSASSDAPHLTPMGPSTDQPSDQPFREGKGKVEFEDSSGDRDGLPGESSGLAQEGARSFRLRVAS